MNAGINESVDMANIGPHMDMPEESRKSLNPIGTVYLVGLVR